MKRKRAATVARPLVAAEEIIEAEVPLTPEQEAELFAALLEADERVRAATEAIEKVVMLRGGRGRANFYDRHLLSGISMWEKYGTHVVSKTHCITCKNPVE